MGIFTKEEGQSGSEIETVIGPSVRVEGNFSGSGNVVVEGSLSGTLKTSQNLRIGSQAKVKADIEAANAFIAGEVRGNVRVSGKTELTASARLTGNIETKVLSIEAGATLNGKCIMGAIEPAMNHKPAALGVRPTQPKANKPSTPDV